MRVQRCQRKLVAYWDSVIASYLRSGRPHKSLQAYLSMLDDGVQPDLRIFLHLFKACSYTRDLEQGKALHLHAHDLGFTSDPFVACSLLRMFGKCGSLFCSEKVFHHLPNGKRDVVVWNSMLSAYAEQGHAEKVLQLYSQMRHKGTRPDHTTYAVTISACGSLAESKESAALDHNHTPKLVHLEIGQALHADAQRDGLALHEMVAGSLTCLYGKCGAIRQAENTFVKLTLPTVVTWTALMSAYKEHNQEDTALHLYLQMHKEGVVADQHVFPNLLQACGFLALKKEATLMEGEKLKVVPLILGQSLHVDAARKGFMSNMFIASTIVFMYAKCGSLRKAENFFNKVGNKDFVLWTSMLSAYVEHGQVNKAFEIYKQMQKRGISLDGVTFARILQACGEAGQPEFCWRIHFNIVSSVRDPSCFLETCLVHAYGECACLADALVVFDNLTEPDCISWNVSIAGHVKEGTCETCTFYERMQTTGSMPNNVTFFSILCACSHGGYVPEGLEFFAAMSRDHGIQADWKHYVIVTDLLARAGDLMKARNVAELMPAEVDVSLVSPLLGACLWHGNLELGEEVFYCSSELEGQDYVFMSNLYAYAGLNDYGGSFMVKKRH